MRFGKAVTVAASLVCALACASCGTLSGGGKRAATGKLAYQSGDDLAGQFGYMGASGARLKEKPVENGVKPPASLSKRGRYGTIRLGSGEDATYSFVFDETRGPDTGFDVLYFDVNNNEDLNDDRPVEADTSITGQYAQFPPIRVNVSVDGKKYDYHFKPEARSARSPYARFESAAYVTGTLRVGDDTLPVAIFDDAFNGVFGDRLRTPPPHGRKGNVYGLGDVLCIDVNGDGKFDKDYLGGPEVYEVGKHLLWNGCCYDADLQANGRRIQLTPTAAPCGSLTVPTPGTAVVLLSHGGAYTIPADAGPVPVPAGEYRLYRVQPSAEDDRGVHWRARGLGQWESDLITIAENGTTELRVGPPFVAEVQVTKRDSGEYRFNLVIEGQAGERYRGSEIHRRPEGRVEAPKVRVVDKDGKTVAQGAFRYG